MNEKANISDQLSAYLDGELDEAQARLVEEALAGDAALAKELQELRATRQLVQQSLPDLKVPEDFVEKVTQAAAGEKRSKRAKTIRWTFARQSVAAGNF